MQLYEVIVNGERKPGMTAIFMGDDAQDNVTLYTTMDSPLATAWWQLESLLRSRVQQALVTPA